MIKHGRKHPQAPTVDSERRSTVSGGKWSPTQLYFFGHTIDVDPTVGNLTVQTTDRRVRFHGLPFGVRRVYDMQEQQMQSYTSRHEVNVDPKPHWFGNWRLGYEADVENLWRTTTYEIAVTSADGLGGLFGRSHPRFRRVDAKASEILDTLRRYGVPSRHLADLGYEPRAGDSVLRTTRGSFRLLAGSYRPRTFVDEVHADLAVFDPVRGGAGYITTAENFDFDGGAGRYVGMPLVFSTMTDALGHRLTLRPLSTEPSSFSYALRDSIGRELTLQLATFVQHEDGLEPGRSVSRPVISALVDRTQTGDPVTRYEYDPGSLLVRVVQPAPTGQRITRYLYESAAHPDLLTGIENSSGSRVQFRYTEDASDGDERLNPRVKLSEVVLPGDGVIEYRYEPSRTMVTVRTGSEPERNAEYTYTRDALDTRRRYVTGVVSRVASGYRVSASGEVEPLVEAQAIETRTSYSDDGRFNAVSKSDSEGRSWEYGYNDFNQVDHAIGPGGYATRFYYDVPSVPDTDAPSSPEPDDPVRFDLLSLERETTLRPPPSVGDTPADERTWVSEAFEYERYGSDSAPGSVDDHGSHSTHRLAKWTDAGGNAWTFEYDDSVSHGSLKATKTVSPLGNAIKTTYGPSGEPRAFEDPEGNKHNYVRRVDGMLEQHSDPNGSTTTIHYYPGTPLVERIEDAVGGSSTLERTEEGLLRAIVDEVGVRTAYAYDAAGRLTRVVKTRDQEFLVAGDPASPVLVPAAASEVDFEYTTLGRVSALRPSGGPGLLFEFDEAGRFFRWRHDQADGEWTKLALDRSGSPVAISRRGGLVSLFTYDHAGRLESERHPDWSAGDGMQPGRILTYSGYDHSGRALTVHDSETGAAVNEARDRRGNVVYRSDLGGYEWLFDYDADGRLIRSRDRHGVYDVSLDLDGLGRVRRLLDSDALDGSLTWDYRYASDDGVNARVLALFGRSVPDLGLDSTFDYDPKGRLTSVRHRWLADDRAILALGVTYRADDRISAIVGDEPSSFRYDTLKQLVLASDEVYDYDAGGNRTQKVDRSELPAASRYTYDDENRLAHDALLDRDFLYDSDGRLARVSDGEHVTGVFFDGEHRLREVRRGPGTIRYSYDESGRLIAIESSSTTPAHPSTRVDLRYAHAHPVIVDVDGRLQQLLTWDPLGNLLRTRDRRRMGADPLPHSALVVEDAWRDPSRAVAANGRVLAWIRRDAWGVATVSDPPGILRFAGYRGGIVDRQTGWVLLGSRWYDPTIARFLSEDQLPLNEADSVGRASDLSNLFRYAENDPSTRGDMDGARALSAGEANFLRNYFGERFDTSQIDVGSSIGSRPWQPYGARISLPDAFFVGGDAGNSVNHAQAGIAGVFAHEALHVWQRRRGLWVTLRGFFHQLLWVFTFGLYDPYDYDESIMDPKALLEVFREGSIEQQGAIFGAAVYADKRGWDTTRYEEVLRYVKE